MPEFFVYEVVSFVPIVKEDLQAYSDGSRHINYQVLGVTEPMVKILFYLLAVLGLVGLYTLGATCETASSPRGEIFCEDGEHFILDERRSTEALEIPSITNEQIVIDTRKLRLTFFRDGQAVKSFPVAIGEPKTPTPVGEWKIIHKGGNWGDGFGVRWLGLNVPWGIYGIHGTNKPYTIGTRASHGCIRMLNNHVLQLYSMVRLGTPVFINGTVRKVPLRNEMSRKNAGEDILLVQYELRRRGLHGSPADGRFDAEMEQNVCRLQFFYGLAGTGRLTGNEQHLMGLR